MAFFHSGECFVERIYSRLHEHASFFEFCLSVRCRIHKHTVSAIHRKCISPTFSIMNGNARFSANCNADSKNGLILVCMCNVQVNSIHTFRMCVRCILAGGWCLMPAAQWTSRLYSYALFACIHTRDIILGTAKLQSLASSVSGGCVVNFTFAYFMWYIAHVIVMPNKSPLQRQSAPYVPTVRI